MFASLKQLVLIVGLLALLAATKYGVQLGFTILNAPTSQQLVDQMPGGSGSPPVVLITRQEFDRLTPQMRQTTVAAVLGGEGTLRSLTEIGSIETTVRSWQNPDGSNIQVTFQNDRLVSKVQSGLY